MQQPVAHRNKILTRVSIADRRRSARRANPSKDGDAKLPGFGIERCHASGAAGTHRQGTGRTFSFTVMQFKTMNSERDFVIDLEEPVAVKAPASLSAEDSAKVQALVQRLVKPRLDPDLALYAGATAPWNPRTSTRIRTVESVIILAIMAYFASAALPALGLI
jgi:hypothetical protein